MKQIHVNIYCEPTCHREAVRLFKELNAVLDPTQRDQVTLTGIPFNAECATTGKLTPPCVQVGDQIIERATANDVKVAIQKATDPRRMAA
jgi:hypothetical protein